VGDWYTIGLAAGLGAAAGVVLAGLTGGRRLLVPLAAVVAAATGVVIGFVIDDTAQAIAAAGGGALGALAAGAIVAGAAKRGGTRGGLAFFLALGAVAVAGIAFVPVVGYVEAVLLPVIAARLRGRAGERYAGLRTLAK
jgi:hypothetical protein